MFADVSMARICATVTPLSHGHGGASAALRVCLDGAGGCRRSPASGAGSGFAASKKFTRAVFSSRNLNNILNSSLSITSFINLRSSNINSTKCAN